MFEMRTSYCSRRQIGYLFVWLKRVYIGVWYKKVMTSWFDWQKYLNVTCVRVRAAAEARSRSVHRHDMRPSKLTSSCSKRATRPPSPRRDLSRSLWARWTWSRVLRPPAWTCLSLRKVHLKPNAVSIIQCVSKLRIIIPFVSVMLKHTSNNNTNKFHVNLIP